MPPIIQISLDVSTVEEALSLSEIAVRSGVDWLEVGTPLITCEGLRAIRALQLETELRTDPGLRADRVEAGRQRHRAGHLDSDRAVVAEEGEDRDRAVLAILQVLVDQVVLDRVRVEARAEHARL